MSERWMRFGSRAEFDKESKGCRVVRDGDWHGPGTYWVKQYRQRCPRN